MKWFLVMFRKWAGKRRAAPTLPAVPLGCIPKGVLVQQMPSILVFTKNGMSQWDGEKWNVLGATNGLFNG